VTEHKEVLSAYVPVKAPGRAVADFDLPLKIYIIETTEREHRSKHLRQFGILAALFVGMFVCQWPVASTSANAVPSLPVSAQAAGARVATATAPMRFAFAAGLKQSY
jgi:hypothetical protein